MKKWITRFLQIYFNPALDLRVRLFNVLAMIGVLNGFINSVVILNGESLSSTIISFISGFISLFVLLFSAHTGRYRIAYLITIIFIFFGVFPALFFSNSGYYSSIPYFFVFAVVFTIFMLADKQGLIIAGIELLFYVGLCVYAYFKPESAIGGIPSEKTMLVSIIVGMVGSSISIGGALYFFFRLYDAQHREMNKMNAVLEQVNRTKTEFIANTSHEMRTPLTVISVNVQTVMSILEDMDEAVNDPEAGELLENAQSEIMRLSRMVGGMLSLASMSENIERRKIDFSALLKSGVEMLQLTLGKHGNVIETNIEKGLSVFGNADLLAQVLTNLLQNAGAYTANGRVTVSAKKTDNAIMVTVCDTGKGIDPLLLPRVFERGVSAGGTGFGLYLCKTVVESHGGRIWIESQPGEGTAVYYTLPVYEGQFGGERK